MNVRQISFKVSDGDRRMIGLIVERACKQGVDRDRTDLEMDITATHANGCPLNLKKLLAAEDFDFRHDIYGVVRHLNRKTGALENCFLPRCAAKARALAKAGAA